jgi:hypothetical protein
MFEYPPKVDVLRIKQCCGPKNGKRLAVFNVLPFMSGYPLPQSFDPVIDHVSPSSGKKLGMCVLKISLCECGESNSDFKLGKLTRYLYATLAKRFIHLLIPNRLVQAWELIFSRRTFLAAVPTTCSRTVPPLKKRSVGML